MTDFFFADSTAEGVDKVTRYKWKDPGAMGDFRLIPKGDLLIDHLYQRNSVSIPKISRITNLFDWKNFGVLQVAERPDGKLFVFDGQHRALAAKRRSDIDLVPCMVFAIKATAFEAEAFVSVNTNRKPIGSFARHKALLVSGDPLADFIERCFAGVGLEARENAHTAGQIKCLSICNKLANTDKAKFRDAIGSAARLTYQEGCPVNERLLLGLFWLAQRVEDFSSPRFQNRLASKGAKALLQGANRAAAFYAKGGERVYGIGMLEEINKGLQRKFCIAKEANNEK